MNSDAAVNSDADFGRCTVNSDGQLSSLYITMLVLISLFSDGDFGR